MCSWVHAYSRVEWNIAGRSPSFPASVVFLYFVFFVYGQWNQIPSKHVRTWSCWNKQGNPNKLEIRPHRFGGEGVLIGGQNSNTKCSMTFVNIAVAISALAGGGGQKRFRTETRIRWCFRHFSRIFGCLSARGYWNGILGHFGSFPAMEKRPKMKKTLYIARFCSVFGCQSIENTAKTSVLDWRYSKKRVNYRMLDWKHYKNTVKSNVLEGFTAFMAKNV